MAVQPFALAASAASRRRASARSENIKEPVSQSLSASPCRPEASYRYDDRHCEDYGSRDDLWKLRAQRGAEAGVHGGRQQSDGGSAESDGDRRLRRHRGEARRTGGGGTAAGLRSTGMKTTAPERIDLPVSGMTCAACARSIERTLAVT